MGRRRLERLLKAGEEKETKETVTSFERLQPTHTFSVDSKRDSVYSLQFSLDREYLLVGYADGCIQALTYKDGKPKIYKELKRKYGELPVTCLRFSRQDHQVVYASSADGKIYACSLLDGTTREVAEEKGNEINGMDFDHIGDQFVTGGKDLFVRLYDVETDRMLTKWQGFNPNSTKQDVRRHGQRIFCLKYTPDDKHIFLSGGWDNSVKVWDSRLKNAVLKMFTGPHICGDSIDIEGHKVLTGSWTNNDALQVWDLRYNKILQTLPFHVAGLDVESPIDDTGAYLYCAQFADRNTVLAGGSGTRSIQAISMCDNKVIGEIKLHGEVTQHMHRVKGMAAAPVRDNVVQALDSTEGGRYIAFGGSCQELKLASLEGGSERELTEDELNPKD